MTMKRRWQIALVVAAAFPNVGVAQPPSLGAPAVPSDMLDQQPAEAARVLLGRLAPGFVTMVADPDNGANHLRFVAFASAPEVTGIAGLCQAQVLRVALSRPGRPSEPWRVASVDLSTVYKVLGRVEAPTPRSTHDRAAQARTCAAAGPVLGALTDRERQPRYFSLNGTLETWVPVLALQDAISAARSRRFGPIECTRRDLTDCRDPRAEFAALELRNLAHLEWSALDADEDFPVHFVVRATFVADLGGPMGGRTVVLRYDGVPIPGVSPTFGYGRTQLSRGTVPWW